MLYDKDAEIIIISSSLISKSSMNKISELKEEDFYFSNNRMVFKCILSMYNNNNDIDMVSLQTSLKKQGIYERIGGDNYFLDICTGVTTSFLQPVLDRVLDLSRKREIHDMSKKITECAETDSIADLIDIAESACDHIKKSRSDQSKSIVDFKDINDLVSTVQYVKTGFPKLDEIIGGFFSDELTVLGARPSVGKSALALNISKNVAGQDKSVLFFSLEMPTREIIIRALTSETGISFLKIRTGRLTEMEKYVLNKKMTELKSTLQNLRLIDNAYTINKIIRDIKKAKDTNDLSLVIIDYLQLIKTKGNGQQRYLEVGELSRKLKTLASDLNIPIVALSQLSRNIEQRVDKTPVLADLRESGNLEQDANMVIFLAGEINENSRDIIIAKNRNGGVGRLKMSFIKHKMLFTEQTDFVKYNEVR